MKNEETKVCFGSQFYFCGWQGKGSVHIPCGWLRALHEGEVAWNCLKFGLRGPPQVIEPHLRIHITGPLETRCLGERCQVQFDPSEVFLGTPLRSSLFFPRLPQAPPPGVSRHPHPLCCPHPVFYRYSSSPLKRAEPQFQAPSCVLQNYAISGFRQMSAGTPSAWDLAG